ncbi:MurR/RpiR family transcriptional regulator [Amycolatopsis sp. GM8]|uniref:MurR/RpiR family transcriptional regulator n=1 Tax=Amycolatopsis sp. GM8 TaxID=2896530 RepID=UPI001F36D1BE|nr:MurR/RpiR family transcriptional regulator [Amycolatopsis sp. GM8]
MASADDLQRPSGRGSRTAVLPSVADQVRDQLSELRGAELKVARVLLAEYPGAGLEAATELAAKAGVSAPTVLRFAARIGYPSYPLLQQAIIREVQEQLGSPLRQLSRPAQAPAGEDVVAAASAALSAIVGTTLDRLPRAELDRAVELIVDPRLSVHTIGGRFSRTMATYLATHLVLLRQKVSQFPEAELERKAARVDLGRRDVLVVFDFRRYDADIVEIARDASARGAQVILFTDTWMSPAADVAKVVLPAQVEVTSPFDSLVAATALVELLVEAVVERLGNRVPQRLSDIESVDEP